MGIPLGLKGCNVLLEGPDGVSIPSQMGIPLGRKCSIPLWKESFMSQYPRRWASPWDPPTENWRAENIHLVSIPSQMGIPLGQVGK